MDWRAAAPLENSELYLEVRERRRKLLLFACDFYRGAPGFVMIKQAVFQVTTDERWHWTLQYLYLALSIACVCFAIVKTNELYAMYRKIKPTRVRGSKRLTPPNGFVAGGLLYFDRDNPAILVQATKISCIERREPPLLLAATYLAGLMLLLMWTTKAHAVTFMDRFIPCVQRLRCFSNKIAGWLKTGTVGRTNPEVSTQKYYAQAKS